MVQYGLDDDLAFAALSDRTRRHILECLGRGDSSVGELALQHDMTITGMRKHVQILEAAGVVTTEKIGRVRFCRLGPRRLEEETAWIARFQHMVEDRLDALGGFLERTEGESS
jgi:DNA-binding transcriptional ArsR family regulator